MSMAVVTSYTITCDHPKCTMFIRGTSRAGVRSSARKRGWQISASDVHADRCPDHKTGNENEEG